MELSDKAGAKAIKAEDSTILARTGSTAYGGSSGIQKGVFATEQWGGGLALGPLGRPEAAGVNSKVSLLPQ